VTAVVSSRARRVVVVGGGLAGLTATLKLAEANVPVDLISLVPVKRSHSVCAQGGINASMDTKGEGDSPRVHLEETVYGGDFLANQPLVLGMCEAAPSIIHMLDRMGVPFNRTPEGTIDVRRFGGSLYHRTAFAGASTGQQLLYALDDQVRRLETVDVTDERGVVVRGEKLVRKFEHWDFLTIVKDAHGTCVGVVAQDLKSMQIRAFPADAVVLATGGCGHLFGSSTLSVICHGTAASAAYQAGAAFANGEFVQVHPTAIPGADKLRLVSESARGEGGRVWVPKDRSERRAGKDVPDKERDYFLERLYPEYGNLVPRDVASRAIFGVCLHERRGVFSDVTGKNENEVYLDLTHKDEKLLESRLASVLETYQKFTGVDPKTNPMKVFPAVHYTMGGLWVDYEKGAHGAPARGSPRNHATNVPGLYAVGEVEYQYHGANRLGANSLLACIYAGTLVGPAVAAYRRATREGTSDLPKSIYEKAEKVAFEDYARILRQNEDDEAAENPYAIFADLGAAMLEGCTVERDDAGLDTLVEKLDALDDRMKRARSTDTSPRVNQGAPFVRHLDMMLVLAGVIAKCARRRE
jgi:succinate dehydrogenase / fumarate reductase flavoprotein subunit